MIARQIDHLRRELERACRTLDRRVQIMEVCGTHTVSVFRSGLRAMLPACIRLVSGPGCPVCVTAQRHIDAAIELATRERVVIATYGDMLRVPGRLGSLESVRARGATVRVVNSARTALSLARELPDAQVVFLAVGFETTAPATAATVLDANYNGVENFSVLMCHKLIVPAMLALLSAGDAPPARDRPDAGQGLDGFIGPGHVSVIIGSDAYRPVVEQHHKPVVVAGFEPNQILHAIIRLIGQIVGGRAEVENVYERVVRRDGNRVALGLLNRVFEAADAPWRELGVIAGSGFELRRPFRRFDALRRFGVRLGEDVDDPACRCGEVICGRAEPAECALFDNGCSPLTPIGPCMVSSEGTCAAWYKYNRRMAGVRS